MKAAYNHVYCLSKQIRWYSILFSAVTYVMCIITGACMLTNIIISTS